MESAVAFPVVQAGEPIVLSASTFVVFERCPEQAAGRVRGVYGPESRSSFIGGLAHRVFARHLGGDEIPPERFEAVCREEIGISMNAKLAELGMKPSQLAGVIEEVRSLYGRFTTLSRAGCAGAEVALEIESAADVTLRGRVDAVFDGGERGVRLVDWKTGGLGDPGSQLAFYALLWALDRGEIPARVEAVSIGTGERVDSTPTALGLQEVANRVGHAIEVLRSAQGAGGSLERRAGPWCRWCPQRDGCPDGTAASALAG